MTIAKLIQCLNWQWLGLWLVLGCGVSMGEVRISEFVAVGSTLDDADGESGDWIELSNPGAETVDLGGYALTDDPADRQRWVFPAVALGAGERLVVFATGKDRREAGGELHTNFQLAAEGEYLALVAPDGGVSEFGERYPEQRSGASYGTGEDGTVGYFAVPTPGAANGAALGGFAGGVTFSVGSGVFGGSVRVELAPGTPGARVVYTTDGSEPELLRGEVYDGREIVVGRTRVLRARAFAPGLVPSPVATRTYILPAMTARGGELATAVVGDEDYGGLVEGSLVSLPVLSLAADPGAVFGPDGIYTDFFAGGIGAEVPVSVDFFNAGEAGSFALDAGLRIHGGQARVHAKKPLRLHFRERYGERRLEFPLFDGSAVQTFDALVLRGGGHDAWTSDWGDGRNDLTESASYLRDEFLRRTELEMGLLSPRGRWVQLFINGEYRGMYNVHERVDAAFFADHLGGGEEDWDVVKPEGGSATTPPSAFPASGDLTAWRNLVAAVAPGDDGAFAAAQEFLELDGYIDALITRIWSGDHDWLGPVVLRFGGGLEFELNQTNNRNWFAGRRSRGEPGAFRYFTWDGEISMGNDRFQTPGLAEVNREERFDLTLVGEPDSPAVPYAALRDHPEFRLRFADRLQRHFFGDGAMTPARLVARWEGLGALISEPLVAESARWGNLHGGEPLTRDAEWAEEFAWVRDTFLQEQTARVLGYFQGRGLYPETGAPAFSVPPGTVEGAVLLEIGNPSGAGEVWYTLDGTDPRRAAVTSMQVLVDEFAAAEVLVPSEANGGAGLAGGWTGTEAPANAQAWEPGETGVGYEQVPADYTGLVRTDVGAAMDGVNGSVFVRVPFEVEDLAAAQAAARLVLQMKYDDGFVAYLNGGEVARANAPAEPAWDSLATASNPDSAAVVFEAFDVTAHAERLVEGRNVLAVHGLNVDMASSDFLVSPRLVAFGETEEAGLAPGAEVFDDEILLGQTVTVKARVRSPGGAWSALAEASYRVDAAPAGADNLVVSEFHYRPGSVRPGEEDVAGGRGDFEFIELSSVSAGGVDLAGARFVDGVEFVFPDGEASLLGAGESVVVVRNEVAFRARYGQRARVAGEFAGGTGLSNGGETVVLVGADGQVIAGFAYDDERPWPEAADGDGASVVLREVAAGRGGKASDWRASFVDEGTPGFPEPDLDRDGLVDAWEERWFGGLDEVATGDSDSDGLDHAGEMAAGTDPTHADTDGDGLLDGEEGGGRDPMVADTDGDGLSDGDEVSRGSDPTAADSDGDGLLDGKEVVAGTEVLVADSDGDGIGDGDEVAAGSDPLDAAGREVPGEGLLLLYAAMERAPDGRVHDAVGEGGVIEGEGWTGEGGGVIGGALLAGNGLADFGAVGDPGYGALTVSFWFRVEDADVERVLLSKGDGEEGWSIGVGDEELRWSVEGESVAVPVEAGEWRHVVLRISGAGGEVHGFLDGEKVEVGLLGDVVVSERPLTLGGGVRYDDLAAWAFPLSDATVGRVYDAGRAAGVNVVAAVTRGGDADGDGIDDAAELAVFGTTDRDGSGDADGDGLLDGEEFAVGGDPLAADGDGDGVGDAQEVRDGGDPLDAAVSGPVAVANGLALWATLDAADRSGDVSGAVVFDSTVPAEHGTVVGVTSAVDGLVGGGIGLERGAVAFADAAGAGADDFSVGVWVRPDRRPGGRVQVAVAGGTASDGGAWVLGLAGDRCVASGQMAGGRPWLVEGGAAPALGQWTHLLLVLDRVAGLARLYVDGVEVGGGGGFAALAEGDGAGGEGILLGESLDGAADELAAWGRALSAAEAGALYRAGRARTGSGEIGVPATGGGELEVAPELVTVRLNPDEELSTAIEIRNVGGGLLNTLWSVEGEDSEPLDVVLDRLEDGLTAVAGQVPDRFLFSEGDEGTFIEDGGEDMFDFANVLFTSLGGPLNYTDGDLSTDGALGPGGAYFTLKENGVWVFAADVVGVDAFEIAGNLGADGVGSVDGTVLEMPLGTRVFRGFVKRVWDGFDPRTGTTDPSVNHLVLVEDGGRAEQSFPDDTDDDAHLVDGLGGVRRIYYVMFGSRDGRYVDDAEMRSIAETFLATVGVAPGWLEVSGETAVQLGADETSEVGLRFAAGELEGGRYESELVVVSSDRSAARVVVPLVLEVNHAPTTSGLPVVAVAEDAGPVRVVLGDHFDDEEDGGDLQYRVVGTGGDGVFESVTVDAGSGELVVVFAADANGVAGVRVEAVDSGGLAVDSELAVIVNAVNDAPRALDVPPVVAAADGTVVPLPVWRLFTDPDAGDALVYELVGAPVGAIFESVVLDDDPEVLRVVLVETQVGRGTIRVRATDAAGGQGEVDVEVVLGALAPLELAVGAVEPAADGEGWVQTVRVRNPAARAVAGFELEVAGPGVGTEVDGGVREGEAVVVAWPGRLGPGRERVVVLRYRGGGGPTGVSVEAQATYGVVRDGFEVASVRRDGGEVVVRFATRDGWRYRVEHRRGGDGGWAIAGDAVAGTGTVVEWRWDPPVGGGTWLLRVVEFP